MQFFGVGSSEAILVFVIALIVVGPSRFPEIARSGGRWFRIARRFTAEVTKDLRVAVDEIDAEIKTETGDLRSIRDLSKDIESDLNATARELDDAGTSREPTLLSAAGTPDSPAPDPESMDPFVALDAKRAGEQASGDGDGEPSSAPDSASGV